MNKTWILVANSHRARCFERHAADHALTELADFVYPKYQPSNDPTAGDLTGAAGKAPRTCVASDLTRYRGPELKQRIDHALRLPDY